MILEIIWTLDSGGHETRCDGSVDLGLHDALHLGAETSDVLLIHLASVGRGELGQQLGVEVGGGGGVTWLVFIRTQNTS